MLLPVKSMRRGIAFVSTIWAIMALPNAYAQESLSSVLMRASQQKNIALEYRELRHIDVLQNIWEAKGRMYAKGDWFVIEQESPDRQLICANHLRFWLYLPDKDIRRTRMLTSPMVQKNFNIFKPIIQGDQKALERDFNIRFSSTDESWTLEMTPKNQRKIIFSRIAVTGDAGKTAKHILTTMKDGDYSERFFSPISSEKHISKTIKALMHECRGR